jgi:glycosyltransferase involved in cell wall biosynthesis
MGKIRVLHIITRLIVGGAQENTMFTTELLDRSRYQVDVLSGPQTGSEGSLIDEVRSRGILLTLLPELVREISPIKDIIALWKIVQILKSNQYSIVHTHSSKAGVLGRAAAILARTPIVIHSVHGWSFHDHMPWLVKIIYIILERFFAHFTDALIVVAQQDMTKGIDNKIGSERQYYLVRSAIPLNDFDPKNFDRQMIRDEIGIPQHVPVLGNVGRFSAQKNPLEWIRVAALVKQAVPDCYFLLVGNGPLRVQVENLIIELGISDCTILTGLRRDIPRLLSVMDVFLLTSLWEGLPRVIPQAMRMGLPVIVTGVDGSREAIQNQTTGFICKSGDVNHMAQHCIDLLKNPKKRLEIGARASTFAANEFDLDHMITRIDHIYQEFVQKITYSIRRPI